jgi:glycosyltransferase involved in cell wall biosynthesis
MRILHAIHSVSPAAGGPVEGVQQLGRLAISNGHHVEVVCLDRPDAAFLGSFPLPVHALGPALLGYGYTSRLVPWLRENASSYDIVVVNGLWQYHSFAVWRAIRGTTPYVVFTHGMLDPWFKRRYPLKHIKKWLYWPWAEYRVLRDATAVLFTCEEERAVARQSFWLYRVMGRVVTYGTRSSVGDEGAQKRKFVERYPETRGKRVLLFMGRIHQKKGCDLAIQAFAAVLASDPNWHFVISGPDQVGWQKHLARLAEERKIANRITWTGMVQGDLKWGALHSAEAFFLPSHQENFGIVVAEALACGVPVLISDKVNIWREVKEDGAGLVGHDDLQGATSLLQQWSELPAQVKSQMRVAARASFEKRFEIEKASKSLISLLSAIVSDSHDARSSNTSSSMRV